MLITCGGYLLPVEDTYYLWRILITCGGYLLPVEDTYYLWRIICLLPVEDNMLITCGG